MNGLLWSDCCYCTTNPCQNQCKFGTILRICINHNWIMISSSNLNPFPCLFLIRILMCVSARRPGEEGLYPGYLNRVPFDLLLMFSLAAGFLLAYLVNHSTYGVIYYHVINLEALFMIPLMILYMVMLLGLCMSLAARIKQKTLIRNTVIVYVVKGLWKVCKAIGKGIGKLPLIWKSVLAVLGVTLVDWLLMALSGSNMRMSSMGMYFFLSLIEKVIVIGICSRLC